jgi:hypothetical protein
MSRNKDQWLLNMHKKLIKKDLHEMQRVWTGLICCSKETSGGGGGLLLYKMAGNLVTGQVTLNSVNRLYSMELV